MALRATPDTDLPLQEPGAYQEDRTSADSATQSPLISCAAGGYEARIQGVAVDLDGDFKEYCTSPTAQAPRAIVPRCVNSATQLLPGAIGAASVMPPVNTIQPGSSVSPRSASMLAASASA